MKKEEYRIKSLYITDVNKSHAACYSYISLLTAYLSSHYPVEFYAAVLSVQNSEDKRANYISILKNNNIDVTIPDINVSSKDFTPVAKKKVILYGLNSIKGVGENAIEGILKEREENGPFLSLEDFLNRTNKKVCNKKTVDSLIMAGAFDNIDKDRIKLLLESYKIRKNKVAKEKLEELENTKYSREVCISFEKDMLGKSITYKSIWENTAIKSKCNIDGTIKSIREITDSKGGLMAFITIETEDCDEISAVIFRNVYPKVLDKIALGNKLCFCGTKDEKQQLIIDNVIKLNM